MGSINCKEYVTSGNNSTANQNKNGVSSCGSYQKRSENSMNPDEYTDAVEVCNIKDLQDGQMKQYDFIDNTKVLVIQQKGRVYGLGTKCTHYGAPLHTGVLGDGRVRCPWHGACFNIQNGDIEDFPGLDSLPCYKVEVEKNGQVKVRAHVKELGKAKRLKDMVTYDPANKLTYVILGGGPAGGVCVEALRQEGFTGRIIMVCKESYLPYDRVKISKTFDLNIANIQFRPEEFYKEYGIETQLDVEAIKMNTIEKTITLSNNLCLPYDKVFIATGCTPSKPAIPGSDLQNVITIREYKDSLTLKKLVNSHCHVVCLGSSFIALESAQSLVKQTGSVTLVSRTPVPLLSSFGSEIGQRILKLFQDNNVQTIMNSGISEIVGDDSGKVTQVILKDGSKLPCDILILGTGSILNTGFLKDSGLQINANGSIDTDMYLKTSVEDVFVGGDIANAPVFSIGNERTTIGHYQLAQYHGRIAAKNMVAANSEKLQAVPFFFTMLFGKGFRYSGYGKYSDVLIDGDLENLKFAAYFVNDRDRVVAVASCGRDPIVAQYAEYQTQGFILRRSDLQNTDDMSAWTKNIKC